MPNIKKYLNKDGLEDYNELFWGNIESQIVDRLDAYILHQSDVHNSVILTPEAVHTLPNPPSGYRVQGFTIAADGTVYVAYTGTGTAKVRKLSHFSGDGSTLSTVNEITLATNLHANSINIHNGKLLIADVGANANKIAVVDVSTFVEETSITLPYHGLNTAAYITINSIGYIIGHMENLRGIQLYEYGSNLTRPNAYADRFIPTPVAMNYSQGCCVNNGMYYQLHSMTTANATDTGYVAVYSPSSGADGPTIYPIGLNGYEFEDICVYNGHMYASTNYKLWDFGTQIVSQYDQYRLISLGGFWGDIRCNNIGYDVSEYFTGNVVPKTVVLPTAYKEILQRTPTRCMFRFNFRPTGHGIVSSGWNQLKANQEFIVGNTTSVSMDIYSLVLAGISNTGFSVANLVKSSIASGYTQTLYPNFGVSSFAFEFAILNK